MGGTRRMTMPEFSTRERSSCCAAASGNTTRTR
jgi:hypothetical protein